MKVLFNATTLMKGGSLQVAAAFIRQTLEDDKGITWHYVLSQHVINELKETELAKLNPHLTIFKNSPTKSRLMRDQLVKLHQGFRSDVVFTLFGPAYVVFDAPHICGVADGWVTHSSLLAFKALGSVSSIVRMLLLIVYKAFWYKKANVWIVEAEIAKRGLIKRLGIKPKSIHVVSNTCSQLYTNRPAEVRLPIKGERIRLVCLSAYYCGKNMEIIPEVAKQVLAINDEIDFEFVLTLSPDDDGLQGILSKAKLLGVERYITNIGVVRVNDGPELYKSSHIAFLPSLLETFSANYPEAMAMNRPIITTDLDFARNACRDAALYYYPTNAKAAAEKIMLLINNTKIWLQLVSNGSMVLSQLPSAEGRFNHYIDLIRDLHSHSHT